MSWFWLDISPVLLVCCWAGIRLWRVIAPSPRKAWILTRGHEDPERIASASGHSVVSVLGEGHYERVITSGCIRGGRNPVAGSHPAYLGDG
jgi:hypothetical protein